MKKLNQVFRAIMAVMLLTLCATSAEAVLKDFGPLNFGGFPSWYRDNNNVAVSQCFSRAISPVTALPICNILPNPNSIPPFDATKPITFTPNPPTNYNFPDESFYYSLSPDPTVFAFAAGKGEGCGITPPGSRFLQRESNPWRPGRLLQGTSFCPLLRVCLDGNSPRSPTLTGSRT